MKSVHFNSLAYGAFAFPLTLLALPVYVFAPQYYASRYGVPLASLGLLLLAARLADAFLDPLLGLWIDRAGRAHRPGGHYGYFILLAAAPMAAGACALFAPPAQLASPLLWLAVSSSTVYAGASLATIAHQSWGAALTQQADARARLAAVREGCGLFGVIAAALLGTQFGLPALAAIFLVALLLTLPTLLLRAPRPATVPLQHTSWRAMLVPLRHAPFRRLFAVFIVNGIAAAIPATLFLFFVADVLRLPQYAGAFLLLYFVAAACAMPLWVALASRHGQARTWTGAMLLAALVFGWTALLGPGDMLAYGLICILSGAALGADLALPPALLAGVIGRAGHSGQREGAYFGAWNWANKLNLALAAGCTLPLLQLLGYVPGATAGAGLSALAVTYAALPAVLKLAAAGLLIRAGLNEETA
ncbi:MAG TPA: MFS transporter [Burkholderiaceae bacterium]